MITVFPCYASQDAAVARELAEFLEAGARSRVFLYEGRIQPGQNLLTKAKEGLAAKVLLLLLSPDSAPTRRAREEWKPVLEDHPEAAGVIVATVLLRDCDFKPKLRRGRHFDLRADRLAGYREIKRWLLRLRTAKQDLAPGQPAQLVPDRTALKLLESTIADGSGTCVLCGAESSGKTTVALEFVNAHAPDFEQVVWVYAGARTTAAVFGELADRLDLHPEGDAEQCREAVEVCCAERRHLLVLDDVRRAELVPAVGGASSVLLTSRDCSIAGGIAENRGGRVVPYTARSPNRDAVRWALAGLTKSERFLLAAYCACSPGGSSLPFAAQIAELDEKVAAEAAHALWSADLLTQLDRNTATYSVPATVARLFAATEDLEIWKRRHAEWTSRTQGLLAELEHALCWASKDSERHWDVACDVGRRGILLTREKGRLAETLAFVEQLSWAARIRNDRRMLEFLAREKVWILEVWGRWVDAVCLEVVRRDQYADQMSFDFLLLTALGPQS